MYGANSQSYTESISANYAQFVVFITFAVVHIAYRFFYYSQLQSLASFMYGFTIMSKV